MEHNTAKNNNYPIPLWTGTTEQDPQALVDSVLETDSHLEHMRKKTYLYLKDFNAWYKYCYGGVVKKQ